MPITCPVRFQQVPVDEFYQIDYTVMEHAFATHNTLGRFCDEAIYHKDLANRLLHAGLSTVRTRVPVTASWKAFRKTYYLDLSVSDSSVYELKAATALAGTHELQTLNYLLLLGLRHGKLINFSTPSVEWRFVSTTLSPEDRRAIRIQDSQWREVTPECSKLRKALTDILADWGAFLELDLYREALVWAFGGETVVIRRIPILQEGVLLGYQRVCCHGPETGFVLTAGTEHPERIGTHQRRFLAHTSLRGLQWINLNRADVEFITLLRK